MFDELTKDLNTLFNQIVNYVEYGQKEQEEVWEQLDALGNKHNCVIHLDYDDNNIVSVYVLQHDDMPEPGTTIH